MGVSLRKRKLPSGRVQLYLDIYHPGGVRRTESLGMFLLPRDTLQNRETLKMAEEIRAKREIEFHGQMHGIAPAHQRKASFIKYAKEFAQARRGGHARRTCRPSPT